MRPVISNSNLSLSRSPVQSSPVQIGSEFVRARSRAHKIRQRLNSDRSEPLRMTKSNIGVLLSDSLKRTELT